MRDILVFDSLNVRMHCLLTVSCSLAALVYPAFGLARTPEQVVPITAEPEHRIRFDNGTVRMYELRLPKGRATLMHEHRADSFSVIFGDTEITNELLAGAATRSTFAAGRVGFASTAQGPYSHRVVASEDTDFHVIAMELMSPEPASAANLDPRADPAFELVLDNPRGRAYRIQLAPGESTGLFRRPGSTALFAISAGRIAEAVAGAGSRLWDFETGHFRWMDMAETLSLTNEGSAPVHLVEIEIHRSVAIDPPFVVSATPLRIVSANDGDALKSLGRPDSDLPDSISVIDLSADAPPVTRTVSGTVPSTFTGAPYLAMVSAGRYALIPNHAWGSDEDGLPSPSQVAVVDLDTPDLSVVATLPLPEHAWQVQALPDGERAVAISNHQFHLIELASGRPRIVAQSEPFPLFLFSFAISPDGRSIIATAAEELALSTAVELHLFVLDNDTIRHEARIAIDPTVGEIDQPFAPRFSPDGSRALVLNGLGVAARPPLDAVLSIDMSSNPPRVTEAIPNVGQGLESVAFHPSGKLAVVTCLDGPYVAHLAVIDLSVAPMRLLYHLPMAYDPQGIEFSPDGSLLFVQVSTAQHIDVYRVDGMQLVRSPYVLPTGEGPASMALSPR